MSHPDTPCETCVHNDEDTGCTIIETRTQMDDGYCYDHGDEEDYEWCSVCHEHIFTEGRMCGHLWWSDENGWWTGPGSDDKGEDCKKSFLKLLTATHMGPALAIALQNGRFGCEIQDWMLYNMFFITINGISYSDRIYDLEHRHDMAEFKNGVAWLNMIANHPAEEAVEMTKRWINMVCVGD